MKTALAKVCSSRLYGEPSAFVCSSTEKLIRHGNEICSCERVPAHDLAVIRNRSCRFPLRSDPGLE